MERGVGHVVLRCMVVGRGEVGGWGCVGRGDGSGGGDEWFLWPEWALSAFGECFPFDRRPTTEPTAHTTSCEDKAGERCYRRISKRYAITRQGPGSMSDSQQLLGLERKTNVTFTSAHTRTFCTCLLGGSTWKRDAGDWTGWWENLMV